MGLPKLTRATAIASWDLMAYGDDMVMSPLHHPRACAWNPPPLLEGLHFETKWRQGWEGWWTQFAVLTIVCPPARTRKLSAEEGWEPNANSAHPMLLLPPTLNPPTHFPTPLVNSDQSCEVTTQAGVGAVGQDTKKRLCRIVSGTQFWKAVPLLDWIHALHCIRLCKVVINPQMRLYYPNEVPIHNTAVLLLFQPGTLNKLTLIKGRALTTIVWFVCIVSAYVSDNRNKEQGSQARIPLLSFCFHDLSLTPFVVPSVMFPLLIYPEQSLLHHKAQDNQFMFYPGQSWQS